MSEGLVHKGCGKKMEAVEVHAVQPMNRYVLDDDGKYHEVPVSSEYDILAEEHVCQECGKVLSVEEVAVFQELVVNGS